MNIKFDILVVGGGMVGATFACALGDSRLKVALLDSRLPAPPPENYDLRVSAITLASRILFENLGAWHSMQRRRVSPVEAMQVWEAGGEIRFDAAEIGEPCLAYIVENSVIQQALIERLHGFTNIHRIAPVELESIELASEGVTVSLADGRRLQAPLVVGADGADSAVRRAAGIDCRTLDLRQQGIVATVHSEKPHARTAHQRFLPTGPLALLPLSDPQLSSIVWSADTARAHALMSLDDAAFAAELQSAFGDRLGQILSVGRRQAFALVLAHARAYTAPRLALIGDAAHTVHPLAGQGVNLGFMDAAALAEVLLAAARERDLGAHNLLRRYERARKGENLGMLAVTGAFKQLFGHNWRVTRDLRNWGLNVTNALHPLKRLVMRRASGLEGEVPVLARAYKRQGDAEYLRR